MNSGLVIFAAILLSACYLSVKLGKLTLGAAITGAVIAGCIFIGAGFTGVAILGCFFLSGTLATTFKSNLKETLGIAEADKGKRRPGQVIANGGLAAIAGLLAVIFVQHKILLQVMMAAAMASATADTLSSEFGMVYGKRFYNIINFKPGRRGDNGVVSLEGTLAGCSGSLMIAVVYAIGFGLNKSFAWIVIAGTVGNIADSILGATLEKEHYLNNDAVNFINTLIAALTALMLFKTSG